MKTIIKESQIYNVNVKDLARNVRPKKKKLMTEPNSPATHLEESNNKINHVSIVNNTTIASSRDAPIRMSGNKYSKITAGISHKAKSKKINADNLSRMN